jgi:hypothetical protein
MRLQLPEAALLTFNLLQATFKPGLYNLKVMFKNASGIF